MFFERSCKKPDFHRFRRFTLIIDWSSRKKLDLQFQRIFNFKNLAALTEPSLASEIHRETTRVGWGENCTWRWWMKFKLYPALEIKKLLEAHDPHQTDQTWEAIEFSGTLFWQPPWGYLSASDQSFYSLQGLDGSDHPTQKPIRRKELQYLIAQMPWRFSSCIHVIICSLTRLAVIAWRHTLHHTSNSFLCCFLLWRVQSGATLLCSA